MKKINDKGELVRTLNDSSPLVSRSTPSLITMLTFPPVYFKELELDYPFLFKYGKI